ncbi:hypothetical protein [Exiguobacterium aurantiacum]|uniref:DUF2178 domain-containing protein n=1 Tax=Exiguobacterium aurantiacum TaxID=33987 RepID=A0A377FWT8_9BACL|nr:hypothetical protein [Exiguobacterium aurantiacum]STO09277.1 Uncharacterised protein [Exiguobacterium aurantiacum]
MNKNVFKGLLVMWLALIGLDLWLEQYALVAVTGLGITVYSYNSQQVKRLSDESKTSIMNELNEKTVSFVVLSFLLVLIVGLWFNLRTLPTIETVYVALGGLFVYRGLTIRHFVKQRTA